MTPSSTRPLGVLAGVLFWLALLLPVAAVNAQSGPRLALVVGNGDYEAIDPLQNAVNDSEAIAEALTGLGFVVTLLTNASRAEMDAAIDALAGRAEAEAAEATLVYFSGHGFQLAGVNHIVPTDAVLDSRDVVTARTLRLDDIISRLDSEDRQTLILLDACRNNPLPESVRGTEMGNGLADVTTGVNTYIAFATAPGGVASDGSGRHGPFATALLESIAMPDVSISDMMTNVRASVRSRTANLQSPWDANSLLAPFYFNPGVMEPLFPEIETANLRLAGLEQPAALPPAQPALPPVPEPIAPPEPVTDVAALPADPVAPPEPEPSIPTTPLPQPAEEDLRELAVAVQTELKRVGCYTSTVDGDWGAGSRRALARYFDARDVAALGSEPSARILDLLKAEDGRVCAAEPVVVQAPRQTTPAATPRPAAPAEPDPPSTGLDPSRLRLGTGIR